MNKFERAIEALDNAIFEAEEEHKRLNIRYGYRLTDEMIKEYETLVSEYKEAIITLQMVASGKLRID